MNNDLAEQGFVCKPWKISLSLVFYTEIRAPLSRVSTLDSGFRYAQPNNK